MPRSLLEPTAVAFARDLGTTPQDLRAFAVQNSDEFWTAVVDRFGPRWIEPYQYVRVTGGGDLGGSWFSGGRLNLAEWLLRRDLPSDSPVIRYVEESGAHREVLRGELEHATAAAASLLRELGVGIGGRVAVVAGVHWGTTAFMLGALSLGAVCVPIFSGYGEGALRERIELARADAVVVQDVVIRKGIVDSIAERVAGAMRGQVGIPVLVVRTGDEAPPAATRSVRAEDLLTSSEPFEATPVPADAPAFVLTTSGSSGDPKQVTLTHGGFGAQSACEWGLHLDLRPGETVLWPADVAWLVGPWSLIGILGLGGCMMQVAGSVLSAWAQAPREWQPTILGGSPTFLSAAVVDEHLKDCRPRLVATAGEPLVASTWHTLRDALGPDVPIINMAGGTEIGGCLLASLPTDDCSPGAFGGPTLGLATDVVDDQGNSVLGMPGHLVCRNDWPGRAAAVTSKQTSLTDYYSRFGIWEQKDLALHDEQGWFILGRSDEVMKIAGRRLGPSDVERAATSVAGVSGCVSAPLTIDGNSKLMCLAIVDQDKSGQDMAIREAIASRLGTAFRPIWVGVTSAPPVTTSGKVDRGALRRMMVAAAAEARSVDEGIAALEGLARRGYTAVASTQ